MQMLEEWSLEHGALPRSLASWQCATLLLTVVNTLPCHCVVPLPSPPEQLPADDRSLNRFAFAWGVKKADVQKQKTNFKAGFHMSLAAKLSPHAKHMHTCLRALWRRCRRLTACGNCKSGRATP